MYFIVASILHISVFVSTTFMLYFLDRAFEHLLLRTDWPYQYLSTRFSPTAFHGKVSWETWIDFWGASIRYNQWQLSF